MTSVMQNSPAKKAGGVRVERREETRRRIVEAAGRLFRLHGIDGVGVDAIMREAGLTHGGFYVHFPSKEALAAEVCVQALARSAERWQSLADTPDARRALVEAYVSPERVMSRDGGCVLPTLGGELARRPGQHVALASSIRAMADALAHGRDGAGEGDRSLADLSCLVGAVMLARLAGETALAERILQAARARVLDEARSRED